MLFHIKGTWGCAARKGMLFKPSRLAKGILFGNFGQKLSKFGNFCKKTQLFQNFGPGNAKNWQVLSRKRQFGALLKRKLV